MQEINIRGAYGKPIENIWMFNALYIWLSNLQQYSICGDDRKISHDEATGRLSLGYPLSWKFVWAYMRNPLTWPRDLSFHLNCYYPRAFCWLRPLIACYMLWTQFPHRKRTNFYYRWWVQLTEKYQHTVDLPDGGKRHFYTNNKVWEEHPESLDGKLLNILRVRRLKMRWTAKLLDTISHKFYWDKLYPIEYFCLTYFENDTGHPIVQASVGMTYTKIVKE